MLERNSRNRGSVEAMLLGILMVMGGTGLIWWAWNAPAPQTQPGPDQGTVTVDVLRLADQLRSSSISNNKDHRIAYAYTVGERRYCADGSTVSPGSDAAGVCAERLREIERGTYQALDTSADDDWQIRVIYDSDAPWRSFPVEVRESPWRLSMIGLAIAIAGALLTLFAFKRRKATG